MFTPEIQKINEALTQVGFNCDQAKTMIAHFVPTKNSQDLKLRFVQFERKVDQLKIWILSAMLTQTLALVALILNISNWN